MIFYDPYKELIEAFDRGEITLIEFAGEITRRNRNSVKEAIERLQKEIAAHEAKKESRKGFLFGVPIQST